MRHPIYQAHLTLQRSDLHHQVCDALIYNMEYPLGLWLIHIQRGIPMYIQNIHTNDVPTCIVRTVTHEYITWHPHSYAKPVYEWTYMNAYAKIMYESDILYGVATVSGIDKIVGLFCRISSLL